MKEKIPFGSNEFRECFRNTYIKDEAGARFIGIKNGRLYIALVAIILVSIPTFIYLQIDTFSLRHVALIPLYFLICNLIEYLVHRYPIHKKLKGAGFMYEHVTVHHNFYTDTLYYFEKWEDMMAVFLPILYFLFISVIITALSGFIAFLFHVNEGLIFMFVAYTYYLMYEVLHFSYHTKNDSLIKKMPYMKKLAQFHLEHHNPKLMNNYNFNISFPIFDTIFKTRFIAQKIDSKQTDPEC
jgi:hypothetical protein